MNNTPPLSEQPSELSGFVLLDKPAGITSFQALRPIKKTFKTRRVGHAGTLDQEASGLIVAAVGKSTRLLSYIEAQEKAYRFKLHLGRLTDTLEWTGTILQEDSAGARTANELEVTLKHFLGTISQIPPVYSAIKIEGRRASDHARAGETVEMKTRQVTIQELELAEYACFMSPEPRREFQLSCRCSKGTYIRSLARDIAEDLGTLGCASEIRRTAIGALSVDQGVHPDQLEQKHLFSPNQLLDWPVIDVEDSVMFRLLQGNSIRNICSEAFAGMTFVRNAKGVLCLAAEAVNGCLQPCFHLV